MNEPTPETLTVVRGDDYTADTDRPFVWTEPEEGAWPDLGEGSAKLTIKRKLRDGSGDPETELTADAVISEEDGLQVVTVDAPATLTKKLLPGEANHVFDVQATLSGGALFTLAIGELTVTGDVGSP